MNRVSFPKHRMRRLRQSATLRRMVRETRLDVDDLIFPLFVVPGQGVRQEISSMPGIFHLSVDEIVTEARKVADLGIPAVLLFGLPEEKHSDGRSAWDPEAPVQRAVAAIKRAAPELCVITDVCLCEYTTHGHCGLIDQRGAEPSVDNDATLELLARTALSHAAAGADIVAPADMMDGRVDAIRRRLDDAGYTALPILSYAAKFASSYYGPFREAADSAPQVGDRCSYQMDPANGNEALREVALDIEEGADMVMVKPALGYLDVVWRVKERFGLPVVAYNVSGEYAMVKAAAAAGWIDEKRVVIESLTCIRRAGADLVITYHAKDVARWLTS